MAHSTSQSRAFFENYVSLGMAGKRPDRYLIERVKWLDKLANSDAGMFVFAQWKIDVMEAAPVNLMTDEKFHTEHWPRLEARIRAKRNRKEGTR